MNAHRTDMDLVRQLYGANLGTQTSQLPIIGEALNEACCALADDCTLPRIDELVSRLKTAEQSLTRLRLAMISEQSTGHGTG
jgi:hypothetical protein